MATNISAGIRSSPKSIESHDYGSNHLSDACDICLQVSIAVATLATACFVTLAALNYFTVATALTASFTGLADIILIAALSCKKCVLETPPSDLLAPIQESKQILRPTVQSSQALPNRSMQEKLPQPAIPVTQPSNPLTAQGWAQRLDIETLNCYYGYNLIDPSQPPAPTAINRKTLALPTFGTYESHYQDLIYRPSLAVRLPLSQLPAFPQEIQKLFQADQDIELYFLIYDDSRAMSSKRNLVLHDMVIPEYDATQNKGLSCSIKVGIFNAQGIETPKNEIDRVAHNRLKTFMVHLHPGEESATAISPNTCILTVSLDAPVSSFYTAACFRGRSIAFYTLLIRDAQSTQGMLILQAIQQKLSDTILALQAENSPCAIDVKKLFSYYP